MENRQVSEQSEIWIHWIDEDGYENSTLVLAARVSEEEFRIDAGGDIFIDPVDPNLRLLGHFDAFPMPLCQARMSMDPCDAAGSMVSFADYAPEVLDASAYLARNLD